MATLTVIVERTSTYECEVEQLPEDEDELLDLVMGVANGDEVDGTTDHVRAYLGEKQVL